MTRLANRVAMLERQQGVGVPCDCLLRIVVLYADGDREAFNPRQPGLSLDPDAGRCLHGRAWKGERIYDLRGISDTTGAATPAGAGAGERV